MVIPDPLPLPCVSMRSSAWDKLAASTAAQRTPSAASSLRSPGAATWRGSACMAVGPVAHTARTAMPMSPYSSTGSTNGEHRRVLTTTLAMADVAYDALLETGIDISPLPVWLDQWEHPERCSNPALLHNIVREGCEHPRFLPEANTTNHMPTGPGWGEHLHNIKHTMQRPRAIRACASVQVVDGGMPASKNSSIILWAARFPRLQSREFHCPGELPCGKSKASSNPPVLHYCPSTLFSHLPRSKLRRRPPGMT